MPDVLLQCPEELAGELKISEKELPRAISIAAAVKFFEIGRLSRESAAEFAGMSPDEFLLAVAGFLPTHKKTQVASQKAESEEDFDIEALRRLSGM